MRIYGREKKGRERRPRAYEKCKRRRRIRGTTVTVAFISASISIRLCTLAARKIRSRIAAPRGEEGRVQGTHDTYVFNSFSDLLTAGPPCRQFFTAVFLRRSDTRRILPDVRNARFRINPYPRPGTRPSRHKSSIRIRSCVTPTMRYFYNRY